MKSPVEKIQYNTISTTSKVPLYHQIFLLIKGKINSGEYRPGDYLPSERDLSEIFKVSRITTMRALNELAACNLVLRETGRGTRVQFTGHGVVIRGAAGGGEAAAAEWPEGAGGPIEITVAEFGYQPATAAVAQALQIETGASVQRAVRILSIGHEPFAQVTSFIAKDIGQQWIAADMAAKPLHQILGEIGYSITRVDETVTATLSDMVLSEQLNLPLGAPLIKILRTTYEYAGTPVEHMIGLYRPDRYRYHVSLTGNALPEQSRLS